LTFGKTLRGGERLHFGTAAASAARPSPGTTVCVQDLFYNYPVRRKLLNATGELEALRYMLERVALINPSVAFTVRAEGVPAPLLQTTRTRSVGAMYRQLYGAAQGLALWPCGGERGVFRLQGLVGTVAHHSLNRQFIFLNGRPLGRSGLHKRAAETLANSLLYRYTEAKRTFCCFYV
jgi:DNA mismatch repair protein MLH3